MAEVFVTDTHALVGIFSTQLDLAPKVRPLFERCNKARRCS
jgi:hypothetical protein